MKINKSISNILIYSGMFIIIIIAILIINIKTTNCELNNRLVNITTKQIPLNATSTYNITEQYCSYYTTTICRSGEINQNGECLYKPKGFFEETTGQIILWSFIILFFGTLIFYFISKFREKKDTIKTVSADIAKKLIKEWWCKEKHLYYFKDSDDNIITRRKNGEDIFKWVYKTHEYEKNDEMFRRFQAEILEGDEQGLFTFDVNLSRGEDFIKDGNIDYENTYYDNTNFDERKYPRNLPKNPLERRISRLSEVSPELAEKLQEKALEKQLSEATDINKLSSEELREEEYSQDQLPQNYRWWDKRYGRRKRRR